MRIWIVNPFDPLPGDPEQPGRYATLAVLLREAGHELTWWTASFSHRFKRAVDRDAIQAWCRPLGIDARFIETPPYLRNVSLQRIRSHRIYATVFEHQALKAARPDVIIASNPPFESTASAGRVARSLGARLIVDVQDIWIDNFRRLLPGAVRWAWPIILGPWIRANRAGFAAADAVVGVASGYADEPRRYGRTEYRRQVVPLGIDLKSFDAAVGRGQCLLGDRAPGEVRVIYSGSLSQNYDVLTIAHAAARMARRGGDIRFIFSGRGELESEVRRIVDEIPHIRFLGFAPFEDWAATVTQCDIGLNAIRPETSILFPNKIFYYWAAGLAIVNSIPGECADWIARTDTGVSYRSGDVDDACRAIEELCANRERLAARREAARRSAVERWDRRALYQPYLRLIEELARAPEPACISS